MNLFSSVFGISFFLLFITSTLRSHNYDSLVAKYNMTYWEFDLKVSNTSSYIEGNVSLHAIAEHPLDTFACELTNELKIDSILFESKNLSFSHKNNRVLVFMPSQIPESKHFKLTFYYKGEPKTMGRDRGISNGIAHGKYNVTWTLSEPYYSARWWPCKQVLSDKADSVSVWITTDKTNKAGSVGLLENVTTLPDGKLRYEWKSLYPITYYLVFFAVSNYYEYSFYVHLPDENDSILVQNYLYSEEYYKNHKAEIDATGPLLSLYSTLFGDYPYKKEKYGHCMTPAIAMEHQTMTTIDRFDFWLVAHELAHHWFGNYVTCSDWQNIWINEGFASYAEYLAFEFLVSEEMAKSWLESVYQLVKSRNHGSVFVPDKYAYDENRVFDWRLSYRKGAAIIHTLRYIIADDNVFFSILRTFLQRYAHGVASGEDFKNVAEELSQLDLDYFFKQWYYGEGYPVYTYYWEQKDDILELYIKQENAMPGMGIFTLPLNISVQYESERELHKVLIDKPLGQFNLPASGKIMNLVLDPGKDLLCEIKQAKRKF